ncbi:MAG TPA: VOC family protein [Acidimicrobiales bacterium]|jgi:hypothetical protein
MIPQRLSAVTLGARDLPSLRRFYRGLGWQEITGSDDHWTSYLAGGVLLALFPEEELDAEAGAPDGRGGFTLALNVDQVDQVDEVYSQALAAGATSLAEPQDRSWGGRSAYIADPEGNRWEVAWAPGVVFGERGDVVSFG